MIDEICSIKRGMGKIINEVGPFCFMVSLTCIGGGSVISVHHRPLGGTLSQSLKSCGSFTSDFGMNDLQVPPKGQQYEALEPKKDSGNNPIGVNPSNPLAALHGNPFFLTWSWRFRAVRSTARAGYGLF